MPSHPSSFNKNAPRIVLGRALSDPQGDISLPAMVVATGLSNTFVDFVNANMNSPYILDGRWRGEIMGRRDD